MRPAHRGGPRRVGEAEVGGGFEGRDAVVDVERADAAGEELEVVLSVALFFFFFLEGEKEERERQREKNEKSERG